MCGGEVIQSITQYRERARTNTTEFAEVVVWSNGRLVETGPFSPNYSAEAISPNGRFDKRDISPNDNFIEQHFTEFLF